MQSKHISLEYSNNMLQDVYNNIEYDKTPLYFVPICNKDFFLLIL